jgi:hypothetical protein
MENPSRRQSGEISGGGRVLIDIDFPLFLDAGSLSNVVWAYDQTSTFSARPGSGKISAEVGPCANRTGDAVNTYSTARPSQSKAKAISPFCATTPPKNEIGDRKENRESTCKGVDGQVCRAVQKIVVYCAKSPMKVPLKACMAPI